MSNRTLASPATYRAGLCAIYLLLLPGCLAMDMVPAGGVVRTIPANITQHRIASTDGVTLDAWLYPADSSKQQTALPGGHIVVFCHGVYDSVNSNMADAFVEAGFCVLSFDYRGFGSSTQADKTNLGFADDAAAAVRYARQLPTIGRDQVILYGHSMGGVYALAAASKLHEEGAPVRGIISGSAFSNWRSISNHFIPVLGYLVGGVWGPEPTFWAARLGNTPVLFTHAADDTDVLPWHTMRLAEVAMEAGTPTTVRIAASDGHVLAYLPLAVGLSRGEGAGAEGRKGWDEESLAAQMTCWATRLLCRPVWPTSDSGEVVISAKNADLPTLKIEKLKK